MTTFYAGYDCRTRAAATGAAVYDWATNCGQTGAAEAASAIDANIYMYAARLANHVAIGDWHIPNVRDVNRPEVARELLLDFIESANQERA